MFDDFQDALLAAIVILGTNKLVAFISLWRDNAQILLKVWRGGEPQDPPSNAKNLWSSSIGQRRHDARRGRRAAAAATVPIILSQLVDVPSPLVAAGAFVTWVLVHALHAAYDRTVVAMLASDDTADGSGIADLVSPIVSTRADPFAGAMRPLGGIATAASVGLGFVGWIAVLDALGIAPVGLPNPLGNAIGNSPPLLGGSGIALIMAARLPIQLARQFALGRPSDKRTPAALYLRSFEDDGLTIPIGGISRSLIDRLTLRYRGKYEQLIVGAAQAIGPVVAIGKPGERLPPLGAFRRYYPEDAWKQEVSRLLESVEVIVVSLGETSSFAWEVEEIRVKGLVSHAIFVVPPVDSKSRSQRLATLAELLHLDRETLDREALGIEILGVSFDDTGSPTLLTSRFRDYAGYAGAVLEAVLDGSASEEAARQPSTAARRAAASLTGAGQQPRDIQSQLIERKRARLEWLEQRERELLSSNRDEASLQPVREQLAATRMEIVELAATLDKAGSTQPRRPVHP